MRMLIVNFVVFWAMVLCGCARRPAKTGIDYLVPAAALTEPVHLIDCDGAMPPHCKRMAATWRPGAEQLVAPKPK